MNFDQVTQKVPRQLLTVVNLIIGLKEAVLLLLAAVGFLLQPLSPSLTVSYSTTEFLLNELIPITPSSIAGNPAPSRQHYYLYEATLDNHTNNEIGGLELVLNGVTSVIGANIRSTSERLQTDVTVDASTIDIQGNRALVTTLDRIPAQSQVTIQVLGQMYPLLGRSRTDFTAEADSIRVIQKTSMTGMFSALSRYSELIYALIMAAFIYIGIRRLARQGWLKL